MKTKTRKVANKPPLETPSKIAMRFCFLCFLLIGIVTCGVSIVEDTLLHDNEENVRHGFPFILIKSNSVTCTRTEYSVANAETEIVYT